MVDSQGKGERDIKNKALILLVAGIALVGMGSSLSPSISNQYVEEIYSDGITDDPDPAIHLEASDNNEIATVNLLRDGTQINSWSPNSASVDLEYEDTNAPEGVNEYKWEVIDADGNTQTASTSPIFDFTDPTIDSVSFNDKYDSDDSITVNADVSDDISLGYVKIRVDGENYASDRSKTETIPVSGSSDSISHTISGLSEGSHSFEISVIDRAGLVIDEQTEWETFFGGYSNLTNGRYYEDGNDDYGIISDREGNALDTHHTSSVIYEGSFTDLTLQDGGVMRTRIYDAETDGDFDNIDVCNFPTYEDVEAGFKGKALACLGDQPFRLFVEFSSSVQPDDYYSTVQIGGNNATTTDTAYVDTTSPSYSNFQVSDDSGTLANESITTDTTIDLSADYSDNIELYAAGMWKTPEGGSSTVVDSTTAIPGTSVSFSTTTSSLSDGTYWFGTSVDDEAGNTLIDQKIQKVLIDTTDPSFSNLAYPAGTIPTATPTFSGDVSDNIELSQVEIFIDGSSVQTIPVSGSSDSFSYETSTLSEGSHTADIELTDQAGHTISQSTSFTVDTTPPTIDSYSFKKSVTGEELNEGDFTNQDVAASVSASDSNSINEIEFLLDGVIQQTFTSDSASYTYSASDGEHTYSIEVDDTVGNTAERNITVTKDTTSPTITEQSTSVTTNSPKDNVTVEVDYEDEYLTTTSMTVEYEDGSTDEYSGGTCESTSGNTCTQIYEITAPQNEVLSLSYTANDSAGNSIGTLGSEVDTDTEVGFVDWTKIGSGFTVTTGERMFDIDLNSDDGTISKTYGSFTETAISGDREPESKQDYEYTANVTPASGTYDLTLNVTDDSQNQNEESFSFTQDYDVTDPTITEFDAEITGVDTVSYNATFSDDYQVGEARLILNGNVVETWNSGQTITNAQLTGQDWQESNDLTLEVEDWQNNTVSQSVTVEDAGANYTIEWVSQLDRINPYDRIISDQTYRDALWFRVKDYSKNLEDRRFRFEFDGDQVVAPVKQNAYDSFIGIASGDRTKGYRQLYGTTLEALSDKRWVNGSEDAGYNFTVWNSTDQNTVEGYWSTHERAEFSDYNRYSYTVDIDSQFGPSEFNRENLTVIYSATSPLLQEEKIVKDTLTLDTVVDFQNFNYDSHTDTITADMSWTSNDNLTFSFLNVFRKYDDDSLNFTVDVNDHFVCNDRLAPDFGFDYCTDGETLNGNVSLDRLNEVYTNETVYVKNLRDEEIAVTLERPSGNTSRYELLPSETVGYTVPEVENETGVFRGSWSRNAVYDWFRAEKELFYTENESIMEAEEWGDVTRYSINNITNLRRGEMRAEIGLLDGINAETKEVKFKIYDNDLKGKFYEGVHNVAGWSDFTTAGIIVLLVVVLGAIVTEIATGSIIATLAYVFISSSALIYYDVLTPSPELMLGVLIAGIITYFVETVVS